MDPFSLLGLPRRPLVSEEEVGTAYRSLAGKLHPDQSGGDASSFRELGEAAAILRDPSRRLRNLIDDSSLGLLPTRAADLFPQIALILQRSEDLLHKHSSTSHALGKALLAQPLKEAASDLSTILATVRDWRKSLNRELQELDHGWPEHQVSQVLLLANSFAYAGRWETELSERELALTAILP